MIFQPVRQIKVSKIEGKSPSSLGIPLRTRLALHDNVLTLGHRCRNFGSRDLPVIFNIQKPFSCKESYPEIQDDLNLDFDAYFLLLSNISRAPSVIEIVVLT